MMVSSEIISGLDLSESTLYELKNIFFIYKNKFVGEKKNQFVF